VALEEKLKESTEFPLQNMLEQGIFKLNVQRPAHQKQRQKKAPSAF